MTLCIPSPTASANPYKKSPSWTERPIGSLLARAQTGTGVKLRENLNQANSASLEEAWKVWMSSSRTHWDQAPEKALEMIEAGELNVDLKSIQFLELVALQDSHSSSRANAAVRLLGILMEENLCGACSVHPFLTLLLSHPDASRRYYVVKALWQCRSINSIKAIRKMLLHEGHPEVKRIAGQALIVLESYAGA